MSERPRVLLCSFEVFPSPSGGSRRLSAYLPALTRHFDVVALTVKIPELPHVEQVGEARLLRVPVSSHLLTRVQTFERAVRRQLQSESYALAHFTGPFGGHPLCEEREKHGYRLIYEAAGFPSQELGFLHPEVEQDRRLLSRFRRQELFCLMNADRVLTGSGVTRAHVRSLGVAPEAVRVLRTPAAPLRLPATPPPPPDGTALRLLYLGNQASYQGLPTLLRAVAATVDRAEVTLRIVGPRPPDGQLQLQSLAGELGIQDRVEFLAPVPPQDLPKLLADAHVGVLPLEDSERNRNQGGPLAKASDYLGAGRPVLASDLPVTRELLPARGAVFFPAGNAEALADRMVALAHDAPRRRALGHAAFEFAREHLDAERIQAQLVALYEEVLGAEGARPPSRRPARPLGPNDETRMRPIPPELAEKLEADSDAASLDTAAEPLRPSAPPGSAKTPAVASVHRGAPSSKPAAATPSLRPALPSAESATSAPPVPRAPPERPQKGAAPLPSKATPSTASVPPSAELPARAADPARGSAIRASASVRTPPGSAGVVSDEPEEISGDEILETDAATQLPPQVAPANPQVPARTGGASGGSIAPLREAPEVDDAEAIEEILEADAAVEIPPTIPGGLVDPWLSQVLFGHCPPESAHFTRPTPPTNFPGRDDPGNGRSTSSPGTPAHSLSNGGGRGLG